MPLMFAIRRMLGLSIFTGGFWITVVLTTLAAVAVSALSWHPVEAGPTLVPSAHPQLRATARRLTRAPRRGSPR